MSVTGPPHFCTGCFGFFFFVFLFLQLLTPEQLFNLANLVNPPRPTLLYKRGRRGRNRKRSARLLGLGYKWGTTAVAFQMCGTCGGAQDHGLAGWSPRTGERSSDVRLHVCPLTLTAHAAK